MKRDRITSHPARLNEQPCTGTRDCGVAGVETLMQLGSNCSPLEIG